MNSESILSWSLKLGRIAGTTVRVNLALLIYVGYCLVHTAIEVSRSQGKLDARVELGALTLHLGILFLLVLAVFGVILVKVNGDGHLSCREAVVRCLGGMDLLAGYSEGRQGLIGSLRYAPLPTVAILPMAVVEPWMKWMSTGLAASVVSAMLAAGLAAYLNAWWKRSGVPSPARWVLISLPKSNGPRPPKG